MSDFIEFPKIARLSREITVTEKIDGTNGVIFIADDGYTIRFGSRSRWLSQQDDNFGFWRWCNEHTDELIKLGPGAHHGEWWGAGIQRRYGLDEKRFSLFNTSLWNDATKRPACCNVVPTLYEGVFSEAEILSALSRLETAGSAAAPGFMNPEGVIIWHSAARIYLKKTLHKDDEWKGKAS